MDLLLAECVGKPLWMWLAFLLFVALLVVFDLGVLHRRPRPIGLRESLVLSAFYGGVGLAFGGWIWLELGADAAVDYLTGFVVEKSLALDNIFVIALVFGYFGIPRQYQHRVLLYGILGVVVLRGLMIGAGAAAIAGMEWILYLFAGFLVVSGVKMLLASEACFDVGCSPVLGFMRRRWRIAERLHGDRFVIRLPDPGTGRMALFATPLLLALVMVEFADVVFAVDSIPAIFAITTDTYVVYTSNIFAILGLRALYFALAAMLHRFEHLKYALALILVFIGAKILVVDMLDLGHLPPVWSLGITVALLAGGVVVSLASTAARPVGAVSPSLPEQGSALPDSGD